MPIELSLKAENMEGAAAAIKEFEKLGSIIKGASLDDRAREGSDVTSAEILQDYLPAGGRDFVSQDPELSQAISDAFEAELEKYKQVVESRPPDKKPPGINQWASRAWVAAMKAYMAQVVKRIDEQRTAGGGKPAKLDPRYEAWKSEKYGFTTIGKATGQLLDALDPSGASLRNIRLI